MTRSQDDGFSLIEVLIALAIMTLALSALYRVMSISFAAYRRAHEIEGALIFATTQLETARIYGLPASTTGQLDDGSFWRMRVEPLAVESRNRGLVHWIIVEVGRDLQKPSVTLRTLGQ